MKEATGELSMTAIAVVAIVAIGTVFTLFIYPAIKNSVVNSTKCASAFDCSEENGEYKCSAYTDDTATETTRIICAQNR